ncbi:HAD family hydrolase [Nocardioides kribbensis]|uniref:HAD family hydrolase n=1 Tax=Nocardioides kribbensis TaxID=305517 RepID=UPI0032DA7550
MSPRHVLWDADGVLQSLPGGWERAAAPWLGERDEASEALLREAVAVEREALVGRSDFLADLAGVLERHGVDVPARDLHAAIWLATEPDAGSWAVVERVRAAGHGVHLGTNQEAHRAAHMRTVLGYDERFDVSVYSCDLGVAKPDPAYFERAVAMIGADPDDVVFVDDRADNVASACGVGLRGVHWTIADGHERLVSLLRGAGVRLGQARPHG